VNNDVIREVNIDVIRGVSNDVIRYVNNDVTPVKIQKICFTAVKNDFLQ
jgi:hypothetical protein